MPVKPIPDGGGTPVQLDTDQIAAIAQQFQQGADHLRTITGQINHTIGSLLAVEVVVPGGPMDWQTLMANPTNVLSPAALGLIFAPLEQDLLRLHNALMPSLTTTAAWVETLSQAQAAIAADHAQIEQAVTATDDHLQQGYHPDGTIPQ